ncbi:glutathione S-transferase omega-1-like isoform X2 [Pomacea canaliculata]|uniref:glutathione S-transferase omega-1-like isoform X2 n=1 Tax=Pomacea canaliculata TaxID=400727 RepID=UPI000D7374FE|nr:glutathione S-transferase omega-1-like isoform X2 [Pomacea canaliculata]
MNLMRKLTLLLSQILLKPGHRRCCCRDPDAGSTFPPLSPGTPRLYSMRFCPFAQRARLVLAHKRVHYETVNINLKNKPEWFLERNPKGLVPTLEDDGKVVYESLIVCDYLDDIYPHPRLTPADPFQKALDAMFLDYFNNMVSPSIFKLLRSDGKDEEAKNKLWNGLQNICDELSKRGNFFGGNHVAMLDFMMWPWIERLDQLGRQDPLFAPGSGKFLELFTWIQIMQTLPAVKETSMSPELYIEFGKTAMDLHPLYDLGLDL